MYTNKVSCDKFSNAENNRNTVNSMRQRNEYIQMNHGNTNGTNYQKNEHNKNGKTNTTNFNIINENDKVLKNYMTYACIENPINNSGNIYNGENNQRKLNQPNLMNVKQINSNEKTTIPYTGDYRTMTCNENTNSKWNNKDFYKNSNESGQKWIEIGEATVFWDSLKSNLKNTFFLKPEKDMLESGEKKETPKMINNINEFSRRKQIFRRNVKPLPKPKIETTIVQTKKRNTKFPLSVDTYVRCLNYLTADEILECELVNKLTSEIINNQPLVFKYVKNLSLTEKWAKLPIFKRQYYLHQMKKIRHLKVSDKSFPLNGMYTHEVAALVFQNAVALKSLELLSPEFHKDDGTPAHEPFAFSACDFQKLEKLTIIGCQTLEWLHIFRNCSFPMLKKFEVCYYPLSSDKHYWENKFDFTILGIQGLYKVIYTMKNLYKISIGFDVLFDNADGEIINPTESQRSALEPYTAIRNTNNHFNHTGVPPAYGYPSRKYQSYRGKLCEEDYSDIFSIAYYVAGKYGKLKRIMIKYKNSYEYTENENETTETINEFVTGAANTASVCYNYVVNWFRSPNEI